MTIAFVSDAIYPYNKGGKEKRLYELSTRLSALGHDVHIYCMQWWSGPKHRTENGVHLHAISKLYPLYSGDTRSIKQGLLFGLACLKLFRVKFDVLDVDHMPFFPIYSAWLVCLLRRKKLHGTWHEALSRQDWLNYMGLAGHVAYLIEHISIKLPAHITSTSAHTLQELGTFHGRTANLSLVTPGIDVAQLRALKPARVKCDVLFTGRFVKDKNVDVLIRAVAILAKTIPSIHCMIVGHGVEKHRLQTLVKRLRLQDNVAILAPFENDTDVYAHMKAAKVFCSPSIREGFGMVVLEALGCSTPVVTSNAAANSSRHLIIDGVTGSIVAPKAPPVAAAIRHWLTTKPKDIADQIVQYDWNSLARLQAKVYES